MSAGRVLRSAHRWVAMAFTVGAVLNFFAWRQGTPPGWLAALALVPLAILMLTGLYLLVRPGLRNPT